MMAPGPRSHYRSLQVCLSGPNTSTFGYSGPLGELCPPADGWTVPFCSDHYVRTDREACHAKSLLQLLGFTEGACTSMPGPKTGADGKQYLDRGAASSGTSECHLHSRNQQRAGIWIERTRPEQLEESLLDIVGAPKDHLSLWISRSDSKAQYKGGHQKNCFVGSLCLCGLFGP